MSQNTPPSQTFFLLKLWRNKESRAVIIQIVTMMVLFSLIGVIGRNIVINLSAVGKDFSFGFMTWPAAYDISFSPFIDYTNKSSHLEAGIVGALNTLLVAICGIILASILGFIMGVLRLSNNWLINRIVYVFLEFMRNVPILIHILALYSLIVVLLPPARKAIDVGAGNFFISNRGLYAPAPVFEAGAGLVGIVFIISVVASYIFIKWAKKIQNDTGKIYPVFWITSAIIIGFTGITFLLTGFLALWLALSYYTACFVAEIVRAGILAVNKGQTEAAFALGLKSNRSLQLIIIPQALRVMVPPLCSTYLNLTKNSSLAIAIGYMDITATLGGISLMQTGKEMETMLIVMGFYLIVSLLISAFMNWFNKRIKLTER